MRPRKLSSLFVSVVGGAIVNLLRVFPPAARLLDVIIDYISVRTNSPEWLVHTILFVIATLVIYKTLQSRIGELLYERWKPIEASGRSLYRKMRGQPKPVHRGEERGDSEFQRDMLHALETSRFMYCLLFAGYKMVYEEEQFLRRALEDLPSNHGKEIRFLLHDPDHLSWESIVREIVRSTTRSGNESFKQALFETNVYVAAHHGRENGCSEDILPYLTNVYYVVISDKGYMYDTQQTLPFYNRIAKGGPFRNQGTRKVLTTRNDERIRFTFDANSWGPY